jgi:CubicO group peptidase (beta-lactamase class C family)
MAFSLFHIILVFAIVFSSIPTAFCRTKVNLPQRVSVLAEAHAAGDNFSGAVLLAKNGEVIYEKNFGFSDREKRTPFTSETASNVASIGKMFTSVLVLQLAEEKKLALTVTIGKLLPATKIPNADKITVRHLLMHTSGLGDFLYHPEFGKLSKNNIENDELIALIEQQPLRFNEPGTRFEYSNSGYAVLGKIVERVTGKRYADALNERIIQRIDLKNTRFKINRADFRGLAHGYQKPAEASDWQIVDRYTSAPTPAGGIFSTARDLLAFDRALFSGKLLKKESFEMMKTRHTEMSVPGLGKAMYGYGMMIRDFPEQSFSLGHNGRFPGYTNEFQHYTVGADEYTLVIISNYDLRARKLLLEIEAEILKATVEKKIAA